MPARCRRPGPLLLALGLLASVAPAASAATAGSIAGTVSGPLPAKGRGEAGVRAVSLVDGRTVAAVTASRRGAFRVAVPPGPYALVVSVVATRATGAPARTIVPVSVRSGQRRTRMRLKPRRPKRSSRPVRAAYVQESGRTTQGTAVAVEPFTGAQGELAVLNRGLSDMLQTDLVDGLRRCKGALVANSADRSLLLKELDLQKSRYFDPTTRATRDFVQPDVIIRGTLTNRDGGVAYELRLEDARSGETIETVTGKLHAGELLGDEGRLAGELARRLCRQPEAYRLTLTAEGRMDGSPGYQATGIATGLIIALAKDGDADTAPTRWESGPSAIEWSGFSFTTGLPCSWSANSPVGRWGATITSGGDGTIRVVTQGLQTARTSATATCPPSPVPLDGQAGPALAGIGPEAFTLPAAGGTVKLSGSLVRWSSTGTITVRPNQAPR